ncbi:hypothetical protein [Actinomadura sediminis]|uniref:Uncharacterized protein n=1 Tax=Actinomadura sediminis TaxID=1038904 RepID=A0ABW3EMZ8_9ACTN
MEVVIRPATDGRRFSVIVDNLLAGQVFDLLGAVDYLPGAPPPDEIEECIFNLAGHGG